MTPIFSIVRKHLLFTLGNIQFYEKSFSARIYCYLRSDHKSYRFPKLTTKRDQVFKNEPSKICGRQPLKHLIGCPPQHFLSPLLNTLSQIKEDIEIIYSIFLIYLVQ